MTPSDLAGAMVPAVLTLLTYVGVAVGAVIGVVITILAIKKGVKFAMRMVGQAGLEGLGYGAKPDLRTDEDFILWNAHYDNAKNLLGMDDDGAWNYATGVMSLPPGGHD